VRRGVRRGTLESILEASPDRDEPVCPHYGDCGGCQLQHVRRGAQLSAKVDFVRDALRRIARIAWSGPIEIESGPAYGWRARAELHLEGGRIGYRRARSDELVAIRDCPILVDPLRAELGALASSAPPGASRVRLVATPDGRVARAWDEGGERSPVAATFSQANPSLAGALVRRALGRARGGTALDLYAGGGFFTLPLAERFGTVHAVESERDSVRLGETAARAAGISNVRWHAVPVAEWLATGGGEPRPDFVLLDPPRAGAGPEVVRGIAELRPARIAYVSCDPTTLARDLAGLAGGGGEGYAIRSLTVLDLFPQSYHVETVAELEDERAEPEVERAELEDERD
jgi:23S rRNA (uracil1939-C5)-methyltransferase